MLARRIISLAIGSLSLCLLYSIAGQALAQQPTGEAAAASDNADTDVDVERFRAEGTPHGRPPHGWASLEWPEKRKVLFGPFAPSEIEKQFIRAAVPEQPVVEPEDPRRLLVFYRCQYPHSSIATANYAYEQLANQTGAFEAVLTDDPQDFRPEVLNRFDAVLLNNTTDYDVTIGQEGREALLAFVREGKGLIGIHAAADSCKSWPEGARLLNGVFAGHPWLPTGTWAFQLHTPRHPINRAIGSEPFLLRDEVYIYRQGSHVPRQSHTLVMLDLNNTINHASPSIKKELQHLTAAEPHRPVAWIHRFGEGRVFYSNLGHNNSTYWNPLALAHYLAGIQYAMGDLDADSELKGQADTAPATP